jgi:hypothetical protein
VQSLEQSNQGSTKLGPLDSSLETCPNHFLRYGLPDSLFQRFSGFLTYSQYFLGYQGPSWTAISISPLTRMHVDLKPKHELKLTLQIENFIKEYISLIRLWSTIFFVDLGKNLVDLLDVELLLTFALGLCAQCLSAVSSVTSVLKAMSTLVFTTLLVLALTHYFVMIPASCMFLPDTGSPPSYLIDCIQLTGHHHLNMGC